MYNNHLDMRSHVFMKIRTLGWIFFTVLFFFSCAYLAMIPLDATFMIKGLAWVEMGEASTARWILLEDKVAITGPDS